MTRRTTVFAVLASAAFAVPVGAVIQPEATPLRQKAFRHPDLYIGGRALAVAELPPAKGTALKSELALMGVAAESAFYDTRAARWETLVLSEPLIPGTGVGNTLRWPERGPKRPAGEDAIEGRVWEALTRYLDRFSAQLRVDRDELGAPRIGAQESGTLVHVYAPRVVGGIPVRDSFLSAVVNHGNLVLLGVERWGPVTVDLAPRVTADSARSAIRAYASPFVFDGSGRVPRLALVTVAGEAGYDHRLVWVVAGKVEDDLGSWEGLVDAHDGEVIAFEDTNQYQSARTVVGGVYPVSNDQRPPDGIEQAGWPMPYADVTTGGSTFYTTSGGAGFCAAGSISTTLSGRYVRIDDRCGAVNETSAAGLDLGTSGGTDCTVPAGHSTGDTHSARSGFYELNRLIEQARGYLPSNSWLQSPLTSTMNIPQACNAFWNGASVNFYRDLGSVCRNTGEIAAIFDHEWGHGMDNNGTNPNISSPGESIADVHAVLRLNDSCVGRGFFKSVVCDGYGDECDGAPATGCTGVRDSDFMEHRCDRPHGVNWILNGFTSAQCNNTGAAPGCPAVQQRGPCNREVHCEGQIGAEVGWDLQFRDLRAAPFNLDSNTALELATRLFYLGSQGISSWYTCSVGGGCGATGAYLQVLAADDDNGNLNDGTPHMSAIRAAFERHEIHCATPTVTNSGCAGGPTAGTTVLATALDQGASLSWDPVAGASRYYVYRTEGVNGCDFGKVRVGETTGTTFTDLGLLNGRTYYYSVWPVGSNASCFGLMSACATVVPAPGANLQIREASTFVEVGASDDDGFLDNCESGTIGFTVENVGNASLTNVRVVSVTPLTHPLTVVTSPLPATLAPSLASCGVASGSFTVVPQGMGYDETSEFLIEVTADELSPQTRSRVVRVGSVESDFQTIASRTFGFETDLEGWTVASGTFTRTNAPAPGGALGTSFHSSSSSLLDDQCDLVRSPLTRLSASSALSLYNRFDTETPVPVPYDRANVGVLDTEAGTRTTIVPTGGRLYNLAPGTPNGACVTSGQGGWAGTNAGFPNSWAQSAWTSAALNPGGAFTGRRTRLEVAYGTDPGGNGQGFDFDEVTLTNFDLQAPDSQSNVCSATAADLSVVKTDSADPVPQGGTLTYTIDVDNLGPSGATGVTLTDVLPAGVTFVSSTPGSPTCTAAGGTVTCNIGALAASGTATVTIEVTVDVGTTGTLSNTASVVGNENDPVGANNSDSETTTVSGVLGDDFFTVTPCRVVDTRPGSGAPIGGPALDAQVTHTLALAGNCDIPGTAKAVSLNVTVVQPGAAGNLRLFRGGDPVPTVSALNYSSGQTRGNNGIIPLNGSGEIAAFAGQALGTTVEVIIDVNGYFE